MSTQTPEAAVTTPAPYLPRDITAHDRCDGCGHAAAVAVEAFGSELLFCAHHYAGAEVKLAASGAIVVGDRRSEIK